MKQNRSVAMCIVLTIVTCGIYGLYWMYCIHQDVQEVCNNPMQTEGGMVILLTLVTCGIYGVYWSYRMGQALDEARGTPGGSQAIAYLLLSLFEFHIIAWALMQNELNRFTPNGNT